MMNIVCATDDNFVQHCCIMLVSLLSNNKDVEIFVLTEGLTETNESIIKEEVLAYGGTVTFCKVDPAIVEQFPMPNNESTSHISRATYYRLLIPNLIPNRVDKVIYLDCDIVINGSIAPLWNIDLSGMALGAVLQIGYGTEAERLGYPIEYGYFNAGMNIINLEYWRKYDVCKDLISYISENYNKIRFHDQDTLNAVLYDRCLHLPSQWNMTSMAYVYEIEKRGDSRNGIILNNYDMEKTSALAFRKKPIVLHYVAKPKPWDKNCVHPLYSLYYDYSKKTIHFSEIKKQNFILRYMAVLYDRFKNVISGIKQRFHKTDTTRI